MLINDLTKNSFVCEFLDKIFIPEISTIIIKFLGLYRHEFICNTKNKIGTRCIYPTDITGDNILNIFNIKFYNNEVIKNFRINASNENLSQIKLIIQGRMIENIRYDVDEIYYIFNDNPEKIENVNDALNWIPFNITKHGIPYTGLFITIRVEFKRDYILDTVPLKLSYDVYEFNNANKGEQIYELPIYHIGCIMHSRYNPTDILCLQVFEEYNLTIGSKIGLKLYSDEGCKTWHDKAKLINTLDAEITHMFKDNKIIVCKLPQYMYFDDVRIDGIDANIYNIGHKRMIYNLTNTKSMFMTAFIKNERYNGASHNLAMCEPKRNTPYIME